MTTVHHPELLPLLRAELEQMEWAMRSQSRTADYVSEANELAYAELRMELANLVGLMHDIIDSEKRLAR